MPKKIDGRKTAGLWRKRYNKYKKEFDKNIERGLAPNTEKLTYQVFKRAFITESEEIIQTKRKRQSNLSKYLADTQFFDFSYKEAIAIKRFLAQDNPEEAKKIKISDIRTSNVEDWVYESFYDKIVSERKRLFDEGKTPEEVRRFISHVFFGSP